MPNILIKIQLTLFTLHGEEWLLVAGIYTRLRVGERAFSLAAPRPSPMECSTYRHQATCYSILTLKKETQNLSFLNTFMLILLYFIVPFSVHIAYIIIICKQLVI